MLSLKKPKHRSVILKSSKFKDGVFDLCWSIRQDCFVNSPRHECGSSSNPLSLVPLPMFQVTNLMNPQILRTLSLSQGSRSPIG